MRRKWIGFSSLSAVGFLALTLVHCGGTGGGLGDTPSGNQSLNPSCNPESDCLTLTISDRTLAADGADETGFRAVLRDGSGNVIAAVEVCFRMEDPEMATIIEPSDGCQLTDGSGAVSGKLVAGRKTGSSFLIASATRLEARERIVFGDTCFIDLSPNSGTVGEGDSEFLEACTECANDRVLRGATVTFSGCGGGACSLNGSGSTSATTGTDGCASASLLNTNSGSTSEQVTITASEAASGTDSSSFIMEGVEPVCGNGIVETGEACDDGDFDDFDGCTSGCAIGPACGNSILETGESCDDGNRTPGDGCDANCQTESP